MPEMQKLAVISVRLKEFNVQKKNKKGSTSSSIPFLPLRSGQTWFDYM